MRRDILVQLLRILDCKVSCREIYKFLMCIFKPKDGKESFDLLDRSKESGYKGTPLLPDLRLLSYGDEINLLRTLEIK